MEIEFIPNETITKENSVCFIGGISPIRGTKELVDAMEFVDCRLELAGEIPVDFKQVLEASNGWNKVHALGFINRQQSMEIKQKSIAGIVTFLPFPNHINAQPNKIFEYMAAGLPVIGSNFQMWRDLLEKNNCGICVDPTNPKELAEAINYLKQHPEEAKAMGENGKRLVRETYNWKAEEVKLFDFYQKFSIVVMHNVCANKSTCSAFAYGCIVSNPAKRFHRRKHYECLNQIGFALGVIADQGVNTCTEFEL